MRLRRYAVTVMDNWTPMRLFWTLRGARRWCGELWWADHVHLFRWGTPLFIVALFVVVLVSVPIQAAYSHGARCWNGVYRDCGLLYGQPRHLGCVISFCDKVTYNRFTRPCYPGDPMGGAPHLCIDPNFHYLH